MTKVWPAVVVAGIMLAGSAEAAAEPALVAIDDAAPTLTKSDDKSSATLGLTNLTDQAVTLSVEPEPGAASACKPAVSKAAIGAAQSAQVKLTVPGACSISDGTIAVSVMATAGDRTQEVAVAAKAPAGDSDPDWSQLWAFFAAIPVAALVLMGVFKKVRKKSPLRDGGRLEYLKAAYSFKDSWVSNVTVIASVLTAVFGSASVVKAFLGEEAESSIALATVGSAIALVLIGSGPIILNAAKTQWTKDSGELAEAFTVRGLFLATTVTVAGAFGQLWVGWQSGKALELGGIESYIVIGFVLAVLLLFWSTWTTTRQTLVAGVTPPPSTPPSDLARLVDLFTDALADSDLPDDAIPGVVQSVVRSYPATGLSPGDEPISEPSRTAML